MGTDDQRIREKHISFYTEDIEKMDKMLSNYLALSKARSIFLIDKSGTMITHKGEKHSINPDELSALVAASFAATKEIARLLGETEFSVMFHQGQKDNIHISLIGDRAISATLFSSNTTVGMIGHYSKELSQKLTSIFEVISKRAARDQEQIHGDLGASVKNKMDDLFKE